MMDFVSDEPIKINLQGIFIQASEENIRFISSDSYRASECFLREKKIKKYSFFTKKALCY